MSIGIVMNGEEDGQTTITVSKKIKNRFLEEVIGAPKRFSNADEAMKALMDRYQSTGGKEHGTV